MGEYRCPRCGEIYTRSEYNQLDRQPVDSSEDDPREGQGYEKVCSECGARFHSDKWQLLETVDTGEEEIRVSTVALTIPHGPSYDQWFETCLFHDYGSQVTDRYPTQSDAEEGHEKTIELLKQGAFRIEPTGKRLVLEDVDDA